MKRRASTPIGEAHNFGPVSAKALKDAGIETLEQLKEIGWEAAAFQLTQTHPRFVNLNMFRAIIGACLNLDWRNIPEAELSRARELLKTLKG